MTKTEYIGEIRARLVSLNNEEREDAVRYYEEFIDDSEDEQAAMDSLGSPAEVVRIILDDMNRTETPTSQYVPADPQKIAEEKAKEQQDNNGLPPQYKPISVEPVSGNNGIPTALRVILLILFFPAVLGLTIALYSTIFSVWLALVGVVVGLVLGGVALFVLGIIGAVAEPLAGFIIMAAGLFLVGFGLLFFIPLYLLTAKAIPAIIEWTGKIYKLMFTGRMN